MEREWGDSEVQLLSDTLLSAKNMISLALLALENEEDYLVPTAIEEAYQKIQDILDVYCIIER